MVVALLRGHALQGVLVEVHGVRALRGQRGDRALHGARVRDGLRGTRSDTQRGEGRSRAPLGRLLPSMEGVKQPERGARRARREMVNWRQTGGFVGCGLSVKFGEGTGALSANPWGAHTGSTAQHTQLGAQQGHGAEQQPSTSQGEFSNTRGTHSCSRACIPKQLQRGKQVALLSTT